MQKELKRNKEQRIDFHLSCTLYTDPLCCWSWAFEPELLRLKEILGKYAGWKTSMGGLIPSWNNYHDEVNAVSRPTQMGPVWMHAASVAQKKINHLLWIKDPPASSYPSCIAVKSAQLQSLEMGEVLLYLLRDAAMKDGKNIAKPDVIIEAAEKLAGNNRKFNIEKFILDYNGEAGAEAFKIDLQEVQYYHINRFPALLINSSEDKSILLSGYRSCSDVMNELLLANPELNTLLRV